MTPDLRAVVPPVETTIVDVLRLDGVLKTKSSLPPLRQYQVLLEAVA